MYSCLPPCLEISNIKLPLQTFYWHQFSLQTVSPVPGGFGWASCCWQLRSRTLRHSMRSWSWLGRNRLSLCLLPATNVEPIREDTSTLSGLSAMFCVLFVFCCWFLVTNSNNSKICVFACLGSTCSASWSTLLLSCRNPVKALAPALTSCLLIGRIDWRWPRIPLGPRSQSWPSVVPCSAWDQSKDVEPSAGTQTQLVTVVRKWHLKVLYFICL